MILLTGATGYIGGRLLRALEKQSVPIRCLCRNPEVLRGRVAPGTQVVPGDLLQPASLGPAFAGVETAFYLVHAMQSGEEFERLESEAARNFARAAAESGVRRIVFLGGLAHGDELSPHMRSRLETGNILRTGGVPVIEFRASIVIGSGSASFELIRALVERLPVMVTPRWVHTAAQPIAIEDVVAYLLEAIGVEAPHGLIVEIGGADVTSYLGIMREYARQRKLRRWFLAVPFLSPGLSSRWLTLITPVYASIGRFLIESVRTPSVVRHPEAARIFQVRPVGHARAVERALTNEDLGSAETRWSDAGCPAVWSEAAEPGPATLTNVQEVRVPFSPDQAFAPVRRIGGQTGWYFGNWLWRVRGLLDLMTGGVGMRRGRPDPETPVPGSTLDFWRVQIYEPGRRLRLLAEMRVPGRAWLEFSAEPRDRATVLRQIARFEPHGLAGLLYWYLLWPIPEVMFRGMLRRIAAEAQPPQPESPHRKR
ncbi:MAG TPA: SDR family oxidoreductase [Candidatus Sulfopaludibacter sp.]|jgi:uncharacterized protein YbjT (DUF2867 family)|nr:SDR family oxidoreductase [Candidatus Sulfopaludibacter sp.]